MVRRERRACNVEFLAQVHFGFLRSFRVEAEASEFDQWMADQPVLVRKLGPKNGQGCLELRLGVVQAAGVVE